MLFVVCGKRGNAPIAVRAENTLSERNLSGCTVVHVLQRHAATKQNQTRGNRAGVEHNARIILAVRHAYARAASHTRLTQTRTLTQWLAHSLDRSLSTHGKGWTVSSPRLGPLGSLRIPKRCSKMLPGPATTPQDQGKNKAGGHGTRNRETKKQRNRETE